MRDVFGLNWWKRAWFLALRNTSRATTGSLRSVAATLCALWRMHLDTLAMQSRHAEVFAAYAPELSSL